MLEHVGGVDHAVVLVRNLDDAAATWRSLGFTVAPRGLHSAPMGTGNHCVMLGRDYVELLGVLAPTEANAKWRAVLERREGITAIALRAHDAAAGAAEMAARGAAVQPVMRFGRPVTLPDGRHTETRFVTFHLSDLPAPGLRLFACQHLTPEATWVAGSMAHANGATGIAAIEILAADPAAGAAALATLLDSTVEREADGARRVPTGAAPLVFLDRAALAARYPGLPTAALEEGPAALALHTADPAAVEASLRRAGIAAMAGPGGLAVPQAAATGVILAFRAAP